MMRHEVKESARLTKEDVVEIVKLSGIKTIGNMLRAYQVIEKNSIKNSSLEKIMHRDIRQLESIIKESDVKSGN